MKNNSIIDEIHQVRKEYAERFNNDIHAICEDARSKQGRKQRPVVSASPKPAIQNTENTVFKETAPPPSI